MIAKLMDWWHGCYHPDQLLATQIAGLFPALQQRWADERQNIKKKI